MASPSGDGCDVLVQSQGGDSCRGFAGIAVSQPVRILVRAGATGKAAETAERVTDALTAVMRSLGTEVCLPCHGRLRAPCIAGGEGQTLNLLAWVGCGDEPDAEEERLVAEWLKSQANAIAVAVVPDEANPDLSVPPSLRKRQVVRWKGSAEAAALDLVSAARVDTAERRIFVSYSHADGVPLAHAIASMLHDARFAVFLDAFALAPASDFAERIEHELLDKAFLLLIETPRAVKSDWVRSELQFASKNRLGIASVWPEGGSKLRGIGWARRWRLGPETVDRSNPDAPSLEASTATQIKNFVTRLHAESILRRRYELDGGLRAALRHHGAATVAAMPGGLEVNAGRDRIWNVSLRPRPAALLDMHTAARQTPPDHRAVMVSATPRGRPEREALEWLAAESDIPHWDEGRLRLLASKLVRGKV